MAPGHCGPRAADRRRRRVEMRFTPELHFAYASSRPDGRVVGTLFGGLLYSCERSMESEMGGKDDARGFWRNAPLILRYYMRHYLIIWGVSNVALSNTGFSRYGGVSFAELLNCYQSACVIN